jgi:HemY protein
MKLLVWLIIGLFASVGIALLVKDDPGYVLLTVGQWTIETSVAVFVIILIVAFFVLYKLVRYLSGLMGVPKKVRQSNEQRRVRRSQRLLSLGNTQLIEGKWAAAEKTLERAGEAGAQTKELGYLGAARAAQERGELARRDYFLRSAGSESPQASAAVTLTQADLLTEKGQTDGALVALTRLRQQSPKHPQVLRKLMEAYRSKNDWQNLWMLLPDLKRQKVLGAEAYQSFEKEVYRELLAVKAKDESLANLRTVWKSVPSHLRDDPDLLLDYVGYLEGHGVGDEAEGLIRKGLDRSWSPKLVAAYGELTRCNPEIQLSHAEALLRSHPQDADLLLSLGRIARRNHHWQKARGYYEASLAAKPTPDGYQELGSLLDQLDDPDKARDCYRNGLQLLTGRELATSSTVLVVNEAQPVVTTTVGQDGVVIEEPQRQPGTASPATEPRPASGTA